MAEESSMKLAKASWSITPGFNSQFGNFYSGMDSASQALGLSPEKLIIPRDYGSVIRMCYDFYQRGGIASTVISRLSELAITSLRNGQRNTGNEANQYFEALLDRQPSRMMRFIRTMALEYFLSGMVLPRVDWIDVVGEKLSPYLKRGKIYHVPSFDLYPPLLINIVWASWGTKEYYLKLPKEDIKLIKNGGSNVKEQQLKYEIYQSFYPSYVETIQQGSDRIKLDVDPILRKEISFSPYPTPYLYNVLEALVFKQALRRMDYAVTTRVINAILLVQEGNDMYPLTDDTKENLEQLKIQILARAGDSRALERLFFLFSNHTTKLTWVTPDVAALLDQQKYIQTNDEISEGLGLAQILLTGSTRSGMGAEVSTWAIQPLLEELRTMILEWVQVIYEQAADLNSFRNPPVAAFTPIKLQDFVKTAAVFAQAYREGNVSRTTRNEMIGLDFETELQLMSDEHDNMKELPTDFPVMPYNTQVVPGAGGAGGAPVQRNGGRPLGSQDTPTTPRGVGVNTPGQMPVSRLKQDVQTETKTKASSTYMSDEEVVNLIDRIAQERGIMLDLSSLGLNTSPENE